MEIIDFIQWLFVWVIIPIWLVFIAVFGFIKIFNIANKASLEMTGRDVFGLHPSEY